MQPLYSRKIRNRKKLQIQFINRYRQYLPLFTKQPGEWLVRAEGGPITQSRSRFPARLKVEKPCKVATLILAEPLCFPDRKIFSPIRTLRAAKKYIARLPRLHTVFLRSSQPTYMPIPANSLPIPFDVFPIAFDCKISNWNNSNLLFLWHGATNGRLLNSTLCHAAHSVRRAPIPRSCNSRRARQMGT